MKTALPKDPSTLHSSMRRFLIPATVFVTGGVILIIEVAATRILSPYFGNTIFTFSSVLTIVLAALSLGYAMGGRLIDRSPTLSLFFCAILLSGVSVLLLHALVTLLLPLWAYRLPFTSGPLLASLALFFVPAFLLGLFSPMAVRLQLLLTPDRPLGRIAGDIFCISTLGSITGSLLSGFVLIPHIGIRLLLLLLGWGLVFLGLLGCILQKTWIRGFAFFLLPLVILGVSGEYVSLAFAGGFLSLHDGLYERVAVWDVDWKGRPARLLMQDRTFSSGMYLDVPEEHLFDYTESYALFRLLSPSPNNLLFLGGGGFTVPKAFLRELTGDFSLDVTEIEPEIPLIARKFFDVPDDPRLHIHLADARRFLHDTQQTYDIIFGDAYSSIFSVPSHLVTKEFFDLASKHLAPGGLFIGNFYGSLSPGKNSLIRSEMRTFRSAFPQSAFFALEDPKNSKTQHVIFVGYNHDRAFDFCSPSLHSEKSPFLRDLCEKMVEVRETDLTDSPILTDDFVPLEYLTAEVIRRYYKS